MLFPYFPKYLFRLNCIGHNGVANATRSKKTPYVNNTYKNLWVHIRMLYRFDSDYTNQLLFIHVQKWRNKWMKIKICIFMYECDLHPSTFDWDFMNIFFFLSPIQIAMKSFVGIKWKMHVLLLLFNEAIDQLDGN